MVVEFFRNLFPFFFVAAPEYRENRYSVGDERAKSKDAHVHDALYEPFCGLEWRFTATLKSFGSLCVSAGDEPGAQAPRTRRKPQRIAVILILISPPNERTYSFEYTGNMTERKPSTIFQILKNGAG